MSLQRVLPRDAFNDANLLKCIGQLTMLIEDGMVPWKYDFDGDEFNIYMDGYDGHTRVSNVAFYRRDPESGDWDNIYLLRPMNSRDPWPLQDLDGNRVFNDKGEFIYE